MKELTLGIRDLVTDIPATCGAKMILCAIDEEREFIDGKPTGKIANNVYDVVLPERQYKHLLVKIPGPARLSTHPNSDHDILVEFSGMTITPYAFNGRTGLSVKATGIRVVQEDSSRSSGQKG